MAPAMNSDPPKWPDTAETQLQSKEHRDLLDIIDKLRSQGISQYVDLPQIIVCGDQSAGKSSALEAISGLSFPTKDNLCTRFATELILRRSAKSAINISIVPGADRSEDEKKSLRGFAASASTDNPSLDQVVENAKEAMGISTPDSSREFSKDVLRVELSGPQQPHLTMVDLPGLFEAGNKDQSDQDAEMVKQLVLSYMQSPRSIILAVVSAKSDFALQGVTKHARNVDPEGVRTLGLITKPDTLDKGSESERAYIELAQNQDVKFRLGWHVLRNRDFSTKEVSTTERDRKESEFFSQGAWASLDSDHSGISALRPRLSHILRDQILTQLPDVLADVEKGISDCKSTLDKLGASRRTLHEQRQCLFHISDSFHTHMKAAIGGMYNDSFFGSANTDEGYWKRLRAVVQNTLTRFADKMKENGHAITIIEDDDWENQEESGNENGRSEMSRSQYADKVKALMVRTRGCELPGTYNPLIVGELFKEQCKPWENLLNWLASEVVEAGKYVIRRALEYATDKDTVTRVLLEIIDPKFDDLKQSLNEKIAEILEPHKSGHPITYNHYLTENIQKAEAQRRRRQLERILQETFGSDNIRAGTYRYHLDVKDLFSSLVESTEADMSRLASNGAIDMMEAYYKVALKQVIDDISVLAVEKRLVQRLPFLFTLKTVMNMEDDDIRRIAAESEQSVSERERTVERLCVLETGLRELSRLNKFSK